MARGRTPKAAHLKVMEGTDRADRAIETADVESVAPECPEWLDEYAKEVWAGLMPELEDAGLITRLDLGTLAAYCSACGRLRWAQEALEEAGTLVFVTPNGAVQQRPEVGIMNQAEGRIKQLAPELGLTPASRKRVAVNKKKPTEAQGPFGKKKGK